ATGTSAAIDLVRPAILPPSVSLAEGVTGALLAGIALACAAARKSLVALLALAVSGALVLVVGLAIVVAETGGAASPYAFSVPMGLAVLILAVPLLPWHAPFLAAASAATFALSAPAAPLSVYVVFALLGAGGFAMARVRRQRALVAFRRVERL